jgi:hypothetical protein
MLLIFEPAELKDRTNSLLILIEPGIFAKRQEIWLSFEQNSTVWAVFPTNSLHVFFSGCPNQEIGQTLMFKGHTIGTCSYFGAATKKLLNSLLYWKRRVVMRLVKNSLACSGGLFLANAHYT